VVDFSQGAGQIGGMKNPWFRTMALTLAAGLFAAGCQVYVRPPAERVVVAPGEVLVTEAPPPPVYEVMPVAPGLGMYWIGGAYHWERPPRPGAIWVQHHYEFRNGRHIFVRGGWR
jgi:hypothetical protein